MYNKDIIKNLLSSVKLSDVVGYFFEINTKVNKKFIICPFHKEKSPSFFINNEKNKYYCFGCKKNGDVITFLMEYKKINFNSAVDFLLKIKNENKHDFESLIIDKNIDSMKIKNIYFTLLSRLKDIYKKNINFANDEINLFFKNRNINEKIIDLFDIGFVPKNSFFILKKLISSDDIQSLIKLGHIIKKNFNNYDRFFNRIIFPIKNLNGNIVGFGARCIDNFSKPKYINSSESTIFIKHKELYGLYESNIKNKYNEIIIVEGYIDVISLYNHGITNVAAILGTSFSLDQFNILKKMYKKIIFCYDGDLAGRTASFNTAKKLLKFLNENIYIGFILLPDNQDPDSIINSLNKLIFLELLKTPIYIIDFIFDYLIENISGNFIDKKIELFYKIEKILDSIENDDIKKIILNYFNSRFLNLYKHKINKQTNNVLSLSMKASIILLKNKHFINLISDSYINEIKKININDLDLFLDLINIFKDNINNKIKFNVIKKINTHNNYCEIINNMDKLMIKNEFLDLIEKIKNQ